MHNKPLHNNHESGDITLSAAIIIAIVMGTVVYFNVEKLNKQQASDRRNMQRGAAEVSNISAMSQATALMQYQGHNPSSDNPNSLPYIYPDPYLPPGLNLNNISPIGRIRNPGAEADWNFAAMKLEIASPDSNLTQNTFSQLVQGGSVPNSPSKATLKFLDAIRSTNPNTPYLIEKYKVEVTRPVTDQTGSTRQITNIATVDVPLLKPPKCRLSAQNGARLFQPNAPMPLKLEVWGVATKIYYPASTADLMQQSAANMAHKNIDAQASRITGGAKLVHTWTVAAPRPLSAVDASGNVALTSYAFIESPIQSGIVASCSFVYEVVAPANCKLWTDKAQIDPGQCVNITSGFLGKATPTSLSLTARNAADPTEQSVSGLTQTPGAQTARFCPPQSVATNTEEEVSEVEAEMYADTLANLTSSQKQAVMFALQDHVKQLRQFFAEDEVLHFLTIEQTNGLFQRSTSQIEDIANLDFDNFEKLSSLTRAQRSALRKAENNAAILALRFTDLKSADILNRVENRILNELETYNPILLSTFIQNTNRVSNVAINYIIEGLIKDQNGTHNKCQTTVTVGPNSCPVFNTSFPNNCRGQTLWVSSGGGPAWAHNYEFCPGKSQKSGAHSAWEVAGIADSPVTSYPCPPDARCYAVEGFEPRTPFVRIDNANSNNCTVTTLNRRDLGCFKKGTNIRMADGTDKSINLLKEGDLVFNPLRKRGFAIRRITAGLEAHPLIEVTIGANTVNVTREHAFVTKDGIKKAEVLQLDDEIITDNANYQKISALQVAAARPQDEVWNLELKTDSTDAADHVVLADGVITGDLYLQEILRAKIGKKLAESSQK